MKTIISLYIFICLGAFLFQKNLQYSPDKNLKDPSFYGLKNFEVKELTSDDGLKITTWFKAPEKNQKIMVYFHGNGGHLGDRNLRFNLFANSGYGIMALSYQGYGTSEGEPNQKGFEQDAKLVTDFLISQGFKPEDMVFYGESLGSFLATKHGAKINPSAVILEAPFYSVLEVAQKYYWYLPVRLLLKDKFESNKYAPELKSKVLVFHGNADRIIPIASGKKLFELFKGEKKFIEVENADHIGIDDSFLLKEINNFLKK